MDGYPGDYGGQLLLSKTLSHSCCLVRLSQLPLIPTIRNLGEAGRGESIPIIQSAATDTHRSGGAAAADNALRGGQKYSAGPETGAGGEVDLGGRGAAVRGLGRSKKSMRRRRE